MEISKTDITTAIKYLEDAAKLYDALAALPMQKATCRSHMIRQITQKLKTKLKPVPKTKSPIIPTKIAAKVAVFVM